MKFFSGILLLSTLVSFSCKPNKESFRNTAPAIPPAKTLTVQFYPFWGGSAEAILERKNGSDKLYSTYHEKIHGVDTVVTNSITIEKTMADSAFALSEKVKWNDDANYGTASGHEGLKVIVTFHKGRSEQAVMWDKLKSAGELPLDLFNLVQLINQISPEDFKLF
jgi:hypothetical protein